MEETTSDYLSILPFDGAVLELGVNARKALNVQEFEHRVRYLLKQIKDKKPNVPIVLITIFPNAADLIEINEISDKQNEFREVLRNIADEYRTDKVYLVEGNHLLDVKGLSADLVHPSDFGYRQIAMRLTK